MMSDELTAETRIRIFGDEIDRLNARLREAEAEIERLQSIINAKLHQRRCHDCGDVDWHADERTPKGPCDKCRSWDTRRVKEEK